MKSSFAVVVICAMFADSGCKSENDSSKTKDLIEHRTHDDEAYEVLDSEQSLVAFKLSTLLAYVIRPKTLLTAENVVESLNEWSGRLFFSEFTFAPPFNEAFQSLLTGDVAIQCRFSNTQASRGFFNRSGQAVQGLTGRDLGDFQCIMERDGDVIGKFVISVPSEQLNFCHMKSVMIPRDSDFWDWRYSIDLRKMRMSRNELNSRVDSLYGRATEIPLHALKLQLMTDPASRQTSIVSIQSSVGSIDSNDPDEDALFEPCNAFKPQDFGPKPEAGVPQRKVYYAVKMTNIFTSEVLCTSGASIHALRIPAHQVRAPFIYLPETLDANCNHSYDDAGVCFLELKNLEKIKEAGAAADWGCFDPETLTFAVPPQN